MPLNTYYEYIFKVKPLLNKYVSVNTRWNIANDVLVGAFLIKFQPGQLYKIQHQLFIQKKISAKKCTVTGHCIALPRVHL